MRLYTSREACELAGVSYRQLDSWVRQAVVRPAREARGTGSARRWSPMDVVQLRAAKELRQAGFSLQKIRRTVSWLRNALPRVEARLADLCLVTDGQRVFYVSAHPDRLVGALAGRQAVLIIPLGEMLRDVGEDLPEDEPRTPFCYDLPEVVEPGESGYFVGYCPPLRGCVAQGRTRDEAQANLRGAIASYLNVLEETEEEETRVDLQEAAHA